MSKLLADLHQFRARARIAAHQDLEGVEFQRPEFARHVAPHEFMDVGSGGPPFGLHRRRLFFGAESGQCLLARFHAIGPSKRFDDSFNGAPSSFGLRRNRLHLRLGAKPEQRLLTCLHPVGPTVRLENPFDRPPAPFSARRGERRDFVVGFLIVHC